MAVQSETKDFIADPVEYFDWSTTQLWSMPQADREAKQWEGLKLRFEQLRDRIGYLKKLADRDGIDSLDTLEDVIPLLFEHTVYKSYPASLLEKSRFGMINSWLEKLTTVPLKQVDVSLCDSIDSWIAVMDAQTDLCIHHSSGTSGTVSLFPKTKSELSAFGKLYPLRFQKFGDPRPNEAQPKAHVISPSFRGGSSAHFRINEQYFERIAHGDETFMHTAFPGHMSADVLYLAGRLRAGSERRQGEGKRAHCNDLHEASLDVYQRGWRFPAMFPTIEGPLARPKSSTRSRTYAWRWGS